MESKKITFNFYGINVSVSGFNSIVDNIISDFKYFININNFDSDIKLDINLITPPYEKVPQVCASMYKTDCISYDKDNIRYVDYSGKALAIYNIKTNHAEFFSIYKDLLYEIVYLFIHSRVGEFLDKKGIHRIHACSFSFENNIYVVMLPQGGGKSTLLMELLKNDKIKLISDDTPLFDARGNIFPFPIRIGVHNDIDTNYIPNEYISIFNRRKFGPKKLINYEFFKDRIETKQLPVTIIYGIRCFCDNPRIVKSNIFVGFLHLFKNCIVGYGLPQVLEYFLIGGFKDNFSKIKIIFSRFYSSIRLLLKHKRVWCFYISNDKSVNAEFFTDKFGKL
jgi:hypothetical protein